MGFDDQGIVALSGAHTIGRAFRERSGTVKEGYGESSGCPYTVSVPKSCPIRHDGKQGVGMPGGKSWTTKWLTFDNAPRGQRHFLSPFRRRFGVVLSPFGAFRGVFPAQSLRGERQRPPVALE